MYDSIVIVDEPNAKLSLPVYLDEDDVCAYLQERATSKGSKSPSSLMRCSSKTSS